MADHVQPEPASHKYAGGNEECNPGKPGNPGSVSKRPGCDDHQRRCEEEPEHRRIEEIGDLLVAVCISACLAAVIQELADVVAV
jgi:hypothetical protein